MTKDEEVKALIASRPYVIAVDVDGTLAKDHEWHGYFTLGEPNKEVVDALLKIRNEKNAYIIIHTCRVTTPDNKVFPAALRYLTFWLETWSIPFDEIWLGTGKPFANEYWDDRAKHMGHNHEQGDSK